MRDALAAQLDGDELGASIAVDLEGETVVDIWGGYRDEERTTAWTQDTIVNGWSTTKCVLSWPRCCWSSAASWTWTRRSPTTGRSSPPRARRTSWCGT
ncbi:serine hydrolase [Blastococcus brunescens]|uniref:Serine hydrolase n=1 Tax=Blastococcus brunescens TaxID=1564165 RepID=A0ABZ1AZI7_9ACTN|nr:serine hydrolase [Blastococcus sp. BMG 8361]WRL63969.1 serine hydrolase [Blastococcus sp. BMG 8361]